VTLATARGTDFNFMRKRILFYCQPVLGIGHYIRSREIVRALRDFEVCFVNGGETIVGLEMPPQVEVINLPALKSDAEFQQLQSDNHLLTLDEIKGIRQQQLLTIYERIQPDILIIELFPFGRRKFDFELLPLLKKAKSKGTKIVCSLRDILVSKRQQSQFDDEACALMNQYFDLLLIHSDPEFQRLEETFPRVNEIKSEVRYTGFVVQKSASRIEAKGDDSRVNIVVSIGGGRVGHELIQVAITATELLKIPYQMHIVTGPHCPEENLFDIQQRITGKPEITLERFTPDFPAVLKQADLSISMAGYNTCMDILSAGVRAILYPFIGNNNQEQNIRAMKLEKLGRVKVIQSELLEPRHLAKTIHHSLQTSVPTISLDLNGAEKSAEMLSAL
jgi:predicted glycosyltransferase